MLQTHKGHESDAKILILGLDNAGKTNLLKFLSEEAITHNMPIQGFNIRSLVAKGFHVDAWDLGGNGTSSRRYLRNYFDYTNGLVFVIDSADVRRLSESSHELQQLLQEDKLAGVPLLILANKKDLLRALPVDDITDSMNLHCIRDRPSCIIACSAKSGEGLQEGMEWLIQTMEM